HDYPGLKAILSGMEADGTIQQVAVQGEDGELPGPWFLHKDSLPELERLRRGDWRPQTVLLSPFDNLIADRDRTELLFDFLYRIEIYTPAAKRQYGYYNMPVLHGDQLIGRVDPRMDRKTNRLAINAIHLEPSLQVNSKTRKAIDGAIESLAAFLGAEAIDYPA
ncbi:MAG TPA: crosslink repair DNA glycosylase YcaQ family protein, partial [Promineifilum sp.]